jgi:hypothetical protein
MDKYSSLYLNEVFSGIQKLARSYSASAIESLRRGSIDPGITPGERAAYANAYAKAKASMRNSGASTSTPTPPGVSSATPNPAPVSTPSAAPVSTPSAAPSPNTTNPRPTTSSSPRPNAPSTAGPSLWSKMNPSMTIGKAVKGGVGGLAASVVADAVVPKFEGGGYWSEVGNELRSFGLETAAGAAGGAAMSGGAGTLPGAIWGAGANAAGKLWNLGVGINELVNPYSDTNKWIAESRKVTVGKPKYSKVPPATSKPPVSTATQIQPPVAPPPVAAPVAPPPVAAPVAPPPVAAPVAPPPVAAPVTPPPVAAPVAPSPVTQEPTTSNSNNLTVMKTPHGAIVRGNVFDKLKADGKIPKDFQLTNEMRVGEQPLPPEIQKAKQEFLNSVKATS